MLYTHKGAFLTSQTALNPIKLTIEIADLKADSAFLQCDWGIRL